mgnify:CR=1 FL=1
MNSTIAKRFWAKVQKTDGCWIWLGCKIRRGYGQISEGGGRRKMLSAHRVSWIIHYGPISPSINILHRCDNPPCVRPDHLFMGTSKDNSEDMVRKGRNWKVKGENHHFVRNPAIVPRGESNGNSKLRTEDVIEIRKFHRAGISMRRLAARYSVDKKTISMIVNRITWKLI